MSLRRALFTVVAVTIGLLSLIGLAELASRTVIYVAENLRRDPRAMADTYADQSWTPAYFDEHLASGAAEWAPYVYWRRAPFTGRYINVDADGVRRSWRVEPPVSEAVRVFVLGGSTVWGSGARDEATLPSMLAKELHAAGAAADVVNLGETGYVTNQALLALIQRLRRGDRPGVVLVYAGINDVYSAFQAGSPGIPQNESNRAAEFNSSQPKRPDKVAWLALSGMRHLSGVLGRRWLRMAGPAGDDAGTRRLAVSIAADLCDARRLAGALGREYGFRLAFYLQPVIFDKRQLTAYERTERARYEYVADLFAQSYDAVRRVTACSSTPLIDLSHEFEHDTAPYYIDAYHLGETGNARIARVMAPSAVALVRQSLNESPR